ncbi:beta-glucosidase, partial [Yersinia kristensenii]
MGEYDTLTEAGEINDDHRIAYLRDHALAVQQAITDGVDVIG